MLHQDGFHFFSTTNFTKSKCLHRAAITGCLSSSSNPFFISEASLSPYESPRLISPCHLMNGSFVSQPLPFQVWVDVEWNQDSPNPPGELLRPLTRSRFFPLIQREVFFACPPPSLWNLPTFSAESTSPPHVSALISFFSPRCGSVVVVVGYPTPSEGWGHGGRPWSPKSRATPQGLDQRS